MSFSPVSVLKSSRFLLLHSLRTTPGLNLNLNPTPFIQIIPKYFSLSTTSYSSDKTENTSKSSSSQTSEDTLHNEHFRLSNSKHPLGIKKLQWDNPVPHPIYTPNELDAVKKTHHEPAKMYDRAALMAVKCMRLGFDIVSRYKGPGGEMTKRAWLNRCIFLETVAGVPGMVGGMARHLKSLRSLQRDHGWIHTLLEEAENERMHLLIFLKMKEPGIFFRLMVLVGQGVFFNWFFITYLISPRTCHRFVGYLEEEAVKTYSGLLDDIGEKGHLKYWGIEAAPDIAKRYYKIPEPACVRDVVRCVRADEANHRDVNHTFAELDPHMDVNPYISKSKDHKK